MPKRIREEAIYIAPDILGYIENGNYIVFDERYLQKLNPENVFDKIKIYERQVIGWFLDPALKIAKYKSTNKGFVILMICLSYIEGVEQYIIGANSNNGSKVIFRNGLKRLYPQFNDDVQIDALYNQGRCGLFHDGMVRGQIIINNQFSNSIKFENNGDIKISPKKFLNDLIKDFRNYIELLNNDEHARLRFDRMFTNLP